MQKKATETKQIGHFTLNEKLPKQGAFGEVFRGVHEQTQQEVAMKILDPAEFSSQEMKRLKEEGELLSQLKGCQYIAQVVDSGDIGGHYYVATEFVEGITLRDWIDTFPDRRPPLEETVRIIAKIAEGLSYAHDRKIVHRDIKPANIILRTGSLCPVIVDFGVGLCAGDATKVLRRPILGTPGYMAPEILKDRAGLRTQADIFSLGIVLYEMLLGQHPYFDRTTASRLAAANSTQEAYIEACCQEILDNSEPPRSRDSSINQQLSDICMCCIEYEYSNRYDSAIDLVSQLNRWKKRHFIRASWGVGSIFFVGIIIWGAIEITKAITPPNISANIDTNKTAPTAAKKEKQQKPFRSAYFNKLWFHDDFENRKRSEKFWNHRHPNITKRFAPYVEPSNAQIDYGRLVLINRGYLVTRDQFPKGASITFKWMWHDGRGTYNDDLCVVLRTTGIPHKEWPHEADDGLAIRFSPEQGKISMTEQPSGKLIQQVSLGQQISRDDWHTIQISDNGKTIEIHFNSPHSPTITIPSNYPAKKNHIALYNREPVAAINKKSTIDNVTIHIPE